MNEIPNESTMNLNNVDDKEEFFDDTFDIHEIKINNTNTHPNFSDYYIDDINIESLNNKELIELYFSKEKELKMLNDLCKKRGINIQKMKKEKDDKISFNQSRVDGKVVYPVIFNKVGTTSKWVSMIKQKQLQIEKEEEKKKKEKQEMNERNQLLRHLHKKMKPFLIDHREQLQARRQEHLELAKKDFSKKQKDYNKKVQAMKERVEQRPLLIQSEDPALHRVNQRRKALLNIKTKLEKGGITNYQNYFNQDELNELNNYLYELDSMI